MRTVPYSEIESQVLALANTDSTNADAATKAKIKQFINRRGRQAYQFHWWQETMEAESRTVEIDGDRLFVPFDQTDQTAIGQVKGCYLDDPLVEPEPRAVRWRLSGENIYLPGYGYTTVFVHFQLLPPDDFSVGDAIPRILRDAIAHAAYSDFLRPSAQNDDVPIEDTAGYTFLVDEVRKQTAMQRQAGKWVQS